MGFAKQERASLCDALDEVSPDAPTLCEGWTAHDLAAHVWCRENDPAAVGIAVPALAGVLASRMEQVKRRWHYPDLVGRIRGGPRPLTFFALPGVDDSANSTEFFVHCEDVRRPAGLPPRPTSQEFEDYVAKTLRVGARAMFRDAPAGVVLERTDRSEHLRAKPGASTVTVVGRPSELLLFAFGRKTAADVSLVGEPESTERLMADAA